MKTCPKCNMSGIPDEAKFCPVCGQKLEEKRTHVDQEKTKKEDFLFKHGCAASIVSLILGFVLCLTIGDFDDHFHSSFLELFAASAAYAVGFMIMFTLICLSIKKHKKE